MQKCDPFPITDYEVQCCAKMWDKNLDWARVYLESQQRYCEYYDDQLLEVTLMRVRTGGIFNQLMVRRKDGQRLDNHWQTLQAVKRDVLGDDYWGYEVYPSADHVIDTSHTYHLWCSVVPLFRTYPQECAERLAQKEPA